MPSTDLILAALLTALWAVWLARRTGLRPRRVGLRATVSVATAAMIAALCTAPRIWPLIWSGYPGDSIHDLGPTGGAGLALLSAGLVLILFWLAASKTRWLEARSVWLLLLDPPLAILLFMLCLMIAPQLYYSYYLFLIPDLPLQWVAKRWVGARDLVALAQLPASAPLAEHLAGLVLRGLVLAALWWPGQRLLDLPGLSGRTRLVVVGLLAGAIAWGLPSALALAP